MPFSAMQIGQSILVESHNYFSRIRSTVYFESAAKNAFVKTAESDVSVQTEK